MHNRLGLIYPAPRPGVIFSLMWYGVPRAKAENAVTAHVGDDDMITWAEAEHVCDVLGV